MSKSNHRPPPTKFGPGAAQAKSGYKLVVGAYMHQGGQASNLPPELAGHGFVAIEKPGGQRQAFGFSPADYGSMNARQNFGRLSVGVKGQVHSDDGAFAKPGVRTTTIPITAHQAQAALAKVAEYKTGRHQFSATRRQCTTFATEVARAAGVSEVPGSTSPRGFYEGLKKR